MQSLPDDLYVFESPATGMLKIGRSVDPQKRLATGTTFCPDPEGRLIVVVSGAGNREQEVHRAFSAFHSHKEWFFDRQEIREWIAEGCDFSKLPAQFDLPSPMQHDISKRHNPRHIEGLLCNVQALRGGNR